MLGVSRILKQYSIIEGVMTYHKMNCATPASLSEARGAEDEHMHSYLKTLDSL